MKKTFKILTIYIIFIFFFSCVKDKNDISLDNENKLTLNNVLKSKHFTFTKKNIVYVLNVENSMLKTKLGEEMGASISAIILYDLITSNNPQIEYNTSFEVNYVDRNTRYSYSLQDLSDVIKGQFIIKSFVSNLDKDGSFSEELDYSILNQKLKNNIKSKVKDLSFAGFKLMDKNYKNDIIYYRVFLDSTQIELQFYLEKESKKILNIE